MFIVIIRYKKPLSVIEQHLTAHRAFLDKGYEKDFFIASGPQNPRVGGVIISQLNNREQLEKILQQDPYRLEDVADYEILEFTPVKYHPNFSHFIEKV